MKTKHALSIVAGILLASAVSSAQAGEYEFHRPLKGLKPTATTPIDPENPETSWALSNATLPDATSGKAYSYSFYDLITPSGLQDFSWSGDALPTWASLNSATGELTGAPSSSDVGSKAFAITATRAGVDGQQIYTIVVGGQTLQVRQLTTGGAHACVVTTNGAAKCWGANTYGQVGDNTNTDRNTPTPVEGLSTGVAFIEAGTEHTCAITVDGAAKCWGRNGVGQLGNGANTDSLTPVQVSGLGSGVASISAGNSYTCAVTTNGAAKCWGKNDYAQLGLNNKSHSNIPQSVTNLDGGVASISAFAYHTCATTTSGTALCWGYNGQGQLGTQSTTDSLIPVPVSGLSSGISTIGAGSNHTCAITTAGAALCWGRNQAGQLGNGSSNDSSIPVSVTGLGSGVVDIGVGHSHACVATTNGEAKCWGLNNRGQVGTGTTTNSTSPSSVLNIGGEVQTISAGNNFTCAKLLSGALKCWGTNSSGQLGNSSTANSLTPVDVSAPN